MNEEALLATLTPEQLETYNELVAVDEQNKVKRRRSNRKDAERFGVMLVKIGLVILFVAALFILSCWLIDMSTDMIKLCAMWVIGVPCCIMLFGFCTWGDITF